MLGMICRADKTGLGSGQTLRLARLLTPDRIMLIDSTPFNGNKQYPEWYKGYNTTPIVGFPSDLDVKIFLDGLDVVISCETFYSNRFTSYARQSKTKTILIANPEFMDWFKPQFGFVPEPDQVVVPSHWMLRLMQERFNAEYLPTPIFKDEYKNALKTNLEKTGRDFLFINGKRTAEDRNGLKSFYSALKLTDKNFTVTIKSQDKLDINPDSRLKYDFTNPDNSEDLYKGFDALILPRRYAGQSLPMTEALSCGLPVIMTDIDPNNKILPKEWLVPAKKTGEIMTRILVDVYSADTKGLAHLLDSIDLSKQSKLKAYEISKQYDSEALRPQYEQLVKW